MGTHEARLVNLFQILSEELSYAKYTSEEQEYAIQRQVLRMRKRAMLGVSGLDLKALSNFESTNDLVGSTVIRLDPFIEHNARLFILKGFERYNRRTDDSLIQVAYDHRHLDRLWRFGPGASNGVRGTHTAQKICQPMTCTAPAIPLVQRLRFNNPYFRTYDIGSAVEGTTLVGGSRLTTVPKNEDTERTIAIEPSGNMALQLALGEYITEVLRSIGLDIRDQQPKNKLLALSGSITDDLATIDMKSASDMFSIELVRRLLPEGVFDTMLRLRSPETVLPDGKLLQLRMMSTMGNGFTFPMMTLIFTALVYAVRLKQGGPSDWIDWSRTGVFGDDIIVPSTEAPLLIDTLEGCGFIVNLDKSFVTGPFRESCGGDFYRGVDVTPFYLRSVRQNSDIYVGLNKMVEWCARQKFLTHNSILALLAMLDGEVFFVPEWHGNDSGFRVSTVAPRYKYLSPVMKEERTYDPHFDMMLAVGGYTVPRGPNNVFTPRPYKTRYVVRRSRLPRGYLDGRDPISRTDRVSLYVDSYAFLLR